MMDDDDDYMRVEPDDLCYQCRNLQALNNGTSVEEFLMIAQNLRSNDPEKYNEFGGDIGIVTILNNAIVMSDDGCTTCGEKILNWGRELGML